MLLDWNIRTVGKGKRSAVTILAGKDPISRVLKEAKRVTGFLTGQAALVRRSRKSELNVEDVA